MGGRALVLLAVVFVVPSVTPATSWAQDGGVWFEFGAARAFPPSGTDAAQASYATVGLRAERWNTAGSGVWAGVHGGRALDVGSDWASADAGLRAWLGLASTADFGVDLSGYAFAVEAPFAYRAATATGKGQFRLRGRRIHALLIGEAGWGRSVIEVQRTDTERLTRNGLPTDRVPVDPSPVRRAEQDLWHYGGGPELRLLGSRSLLAVGASVFEAPAGTYREARLTTAAFLTSTTGPVVTLTLSGWTTPFGDEVTGGVAVSVPLGGPFSARASGAKTAPNPLVRTRGGTQGGMTLRWQPVSFDARGPSVYTVDRSARATMVSFEIEVDGARSVEVMGDFNAWQPVSMEARGSTWSARVSVAPGVYHFGFVVDGEWYLPEEGVSGRISDEWGRDNGTLVVPASDGEER